MADAPVTFYPNVRKAAIDIHTVIADSCSKRFTLRPWNQYNPDNTIWWIVPSTEWPAYARGKAVIFKEVDNYFFGLVVEKGLAPKIKEFYGSKKGQVLIMDDTWCWHKLLKGIQNGDISKAAKAITEATGLPVKLEVWAGLVDDPSLFEPYSSRDPGDKVSWNYNGESLTLSVAPERFLRPLLEIESIEDLSRGFKEIAELDWLWVDFYLGVSISNYQQLSDTELKKKVWDGFSLWEKVFDLLYPWLL